MIAHAVIGANYGDEGKGLITDWLCSYLGNPGCVVRFNGGAQAGHTVVDAGYTGYGRHVFHHMGSGTFAGWSTFLSKFFICNPFLFKTEYEELKKKMHPLVPHVMVDRRAMITTPYDMLINQAVEKARGDNRHGSCGIGINETVERNTHPEYAFTFGADLNEQYNKLKHLEQYWLPVRLHQWGLKPNLLHEYTECTALIDDWWEAIDYFYSNVTMVDGDRLLEFDRIVFEGAQGLALDQRSRDFPYVTRSNTGMRNVNDICLECGIPSVTATYVTRAYVTRHGAGPLPNEMDRPPYSGIVDETNVEHDWQGTLRYAPMNRTKMWHRITEDRRAHTKDIDFKWNIAVTCLDQVTENFCWHEDGLLQNKRMAGYEIANFIAAGNKNVIMSAGPRRVDVFAGHA